MTRWTTAVSSDDGSPSKKEGLFCDASELGPTPRLTSVARCKSPPRYRPPPRCTAPMIMSSANDKDVSHFTGPIQLYA